MYGDVAHNEDSNQSRADARVGLTSAVLRFPRTFVSILTVFVGLALVVDRLSTPSFAATAELLVEDPRASSDFEVEAIGTPSRQVSERFLADQVEVVSSFLAAEMASEMLNGVPDAKEIFEARSIESDSEQSNLIRVTVEWSDPETARRGANALLDAYVSLKNVLHAQAVDSALSEVNSLIDTVDRSLASTGREIRSARGRNRQDLTTLFEQIQVDLDELRERRAQIPAGTAPSDDLNAEIRELGRVLRFRLVIERVWPEREVEKLLEWQRLLNDERIDLVAKRAAIRASGKSPYTKIALISTALEPTEPDPLSGVFVTTATLIAGVGVAAAAVFFAALRNEVFASAVDAERVLRAPLLAEMPRLSLDPGLSPYDIDGHLEGMEAFQSAASAIDVMIRDSNKRSVLFVSSRAGHGTTTAVARVSRAAASMGMDVLVVDADITNRRPSPLGNPPASGTPSGTSGGSSIWYSCAPAGGLFIGNLTLLEPGASDVTRPIDIPQFLTSLESLSRRYDLVVIDAPGLLETVDSITLAREAGNVIVVVAHESRASDLAEVSRRLALVETEVLGFIYTKSSVRKHTRQPSDR